MEFSVIIPARYAATRLPGKVLLDIAGKPMIQHVYEKAVASGAENVIIATDDERIQKVAEDFGAEVCMTSSDHNSGTERIAEAVVALGLDEEDIIVNLQADEPMIAAKDIKLIAEDLEEHDNVKVSSLCNPINNVAELFDVDVVKVVLTQRNYALYFSRAPIAWEKDQMSFENQAMNGQHYKHIGIYGYRAGFLDQYTSWDPCPLEKMESLEQLRVLWYGKKIHMVISDSKGGPSVDTQADLDKVRKLIGK